MAFWKRNVAEAEVVDVEADVIDIQDEQKDVETEEKSGFGKILVGVAAGALLVGGAAVAFIKSKRKGSSEEEDLEDEYTEEDEIKEAEVAPVAQDETEESAE